MVESIWVAEKLETDTLITVRLEAQTSLWAIAGIAIARIKGIERNNFFIMKPPIIY